jgi:hypothetical protein
VKVMMACRGVAAWTAFHREGRDVLHILIHLCCRGVNVIGCEDRLLNTALRMNNGDGGDSVKGDEIRVRGDLRCVGGV